MPTRQPVYMFAFKKLREEKRFYIAKFRIYFSIFHVNRVFLWQKIMKENI